MSARLTDPVFIKIKNPQKAFKAVRGMFEKAPYKPRFNSRGQTRFEEAMGIPPPHEQPWSGARKVPNTCYNWY